MSRVPYDHFVSERRQPGAVDSVLTIVNSFFLLFWTVALVTDLVGLIFFAAFTWWILIDVALIALTIWSLRSGAKYAVKYYVTDSWNYKYGKWILSIGAKKS